MYHVVTELICVQDMLLLACMLMLLGLISLESAGDADAYGAVSYVFFCFRQC